MRDLNSESISLLILFVYKLMIGSSKNNRENYPRKCFWTQEKETLVKFNPGLSANRPSNNWALVSKLHRSKPWQVLQTCAKCPGHGGLPGVLRCCSAVKKNKKDRLYWRLKRFSDWTELQLYPLLVEEKKIYYNLRIDFTNTTVSQAKKN